MWQRLKNSLQALIASLAVVFGLMAGGEFRAPPATAAAAPLPPQPTLTGMAPEAEQLIIAVAAKLAAAAIDEALAKQPTAMSPTEPSSEPVISESDRRSRAGLRQRIPFFSFAARPARTQGS